MNAGPRRAPRRAERDLPPIPETVFREPLYRDGQPYEAAMVEADDLDDGDDRG